MSINWVDVEDSIRAWVKTGSGVNDSQVIWANQNGNRPTGTFLTIKLGPLVPVGLPYVVEYFDSEAEEGEEIEHRAHVLQEFAVSVQAFSASAVNSNSALTARALLSKVQASLYLPTIRSALAAKGLSPFDPGSITDLSAVLDSNFEGRANLDLRFYVTETISEYAGFIETVEFTDLGKDFESSTDDDLTIVTIAE